MAKKGNQAYLYFQEDRIATLEKRYLNSQREATTLRDLNEKLEQEIKNKEDQVHLMQEKIKVSWKIEMADLEGFVQCCGLGRGRGGVVKKMTS